MVVGLEKMDLVCFCLWLLITALCYTLDPQGSQYLHVEGELILHIPQWLRPLNPGVEPWGQEHLVSMEHMEDCG